MPETTLRVRTQAELAGLREYVSLLREAAPLARDLKAASARGAAGAGGGGMAGGGGGGGTGGPAGDGGASDGAPRPGHHPGVPRGPVGVRELLTGREGAGPSAAESIAGRGGLLGMGRGQLASLGAVAGGIALGGGLLSMLIGAGQRYVELSKILEVVEHRFQSAGRGAAYFGRELGFTIARTAPLLETLGGGTNTLDRGQFRELGGFAQWRRLDPEMVMGMGAAAGRRGGRTGTLELMSSLGLARQMGMAEGRLPEHLSAYGRIAEMGFGALGREDRPRFLGAQQIPGAIFGQDSPLAQGERGADFAARLQGVMTSPGAGFRSYLMRAMGFGTPGSKMDYITMRKRMEAGIFDANNLIDVFGLMEKQGLTSGQMVRGIEGGAGGQLRMREIEALVKTLGTERGRQAFREATSGDEAALAQLAEMGMGPEERRVFEEKGLFGLGKGAVSAGERHELLQEGRALTYGPKSLEIQDKLLMIGDDLVSILGQFVTGGMLTGLVDGMAALTGALERATNPAGLSPSLAEKNIWEQGAILVEGVLEGLPEAPPPRRQQHGMGGMGVK